MQKIISLVFSIAIIVISSSAMSEPVCPELGINVSNYSQYNEVYIGTTVKLDFSLTGIYQTVSFDWHLPSYVKNEYNGYQFCNVPMGPYSLPGISYNHSLVIENIQPGQGNINMSVDKYIHEKWKGPRYVETFYASYSLNVIPHPLSIYGIPEQLATANTEFSFNAHDKIAYYDENVQSGHLPIVGFIPVGNAPSFAELGLSFDPATLILSGVPNQAGQFDYQVVAHNDYSTAAPVNFRLNIDYNQYDKPRFRANRKLAAMTPANAFRFNLLNLLETNPGFMLSNQVSFTLDDNSVGDNLAKIAIDSNGVDLIAEPPSTLAGQILTAKITAHSNTGGDSDEVEIQLPVALDAAMKPVINEGIQLTAHAGESMQHNLQANIVDPAQDSNLRLVIDKVEPLAPWLSVSSSEPTALVGNVPTDATGQQYILTLHANNQKGGDSIAQTVKLNIDIDEQRKPQFKQDNPVLNKLFPGQNYFYDFQQNRDIFPEYEDAPYTIKFAEGYSHPDWLVIENNQLKSIGVVPNVDDDEVIIHVVVYNQPGGQSDVVTLPIFVMN